MMKTPIVLVHGAYHGGECWQQVADMLKRQRVDVYCIDLPGHGRDQSELTDIAGDGLKLRQLLVSLDRPPILVGHSYGGTTISEAVDAPNLISHIVYLAAVLLDVGESLEDVPYFGDDWTYYQAVVTNGDGSYALDREKAGEIFYHDCDASTLESALASLCNQRFTPQHRFAQAPWRSLESSYIICEQDRTLPPEIQRHWAKKCDHQVAFDSGHMLMHSQPEALAEYLLSLAG